MILRGRDGKQNHAALDALPEAVAKADILIRNMAAESCKAVSIIYEFDKIGESWCPSFAELDDGRLITNTLQLVAAEELPFQLSLGLRLGPSVDEPRES